MNRLFTHCDRALATRKFCAPYKKPFCVTREYFFANNMLPQQVHLLYCKQAWFTGLTYFHFLFPVFSIQLISKSVRQGSSFLKRRKLSGKPKRTLSKTPTFPSAAASSPRVASQMMLHLMAGNIWSATLRSKFQDLFQRSCWAKGHWHLHRKYKDLQPSLPQGFIAQVMLKWLEDIFDDDWTARYFLDSVGCKDCPNQQGLTSMEGKAAINLCHSTAKKSEAYALLTSKMNKYYMVIHGYTL